MPTTISRLLIANRGEIAVRIISTCRTLGIETVAVFSDPDRDAAFVQLADVSVAIGGEAPADSYLRGDAIVAAAKQSGADAVHPGYGFLSENAAFAQAVIDAGLVFVGPRPETIAAMGSKIEAKRLMADAGVPVLPSAELDGLDDAAVQAAINTVGYPAMVKASAGGGGRGMRIVADPSDALDAVASARREADSAFGDGTLFAERYVAPSRHVEVQIFGDHDGTVIHFHERECSLQRRHQKVIEEAPSPSLDAETRTALHEAAVRAGATLGYVNAGTVEFLLAPAVDGSSPEFFFLEVNTRLQVEHPVTEAILGVDLVALQLAVASGGALPDQAAIGAPRGHAIEARLYAEDPAAGFRPSIGELRAFSVGGPLAGPVMGGVRVDSGLVGGGAVSQHYDPMLAKVIAHAGSREGAARQLAAALRHATIDGVVTNRALLVRTLQHSEFLDGRADSAFFERNDPAALGATLVDGPDVAWYAAAAALALQAHHRSADRHTPGVSSGFRTVPTDPQRIALVGPAGKEHRVDYRFARDQLVHLAVDDQLQSDAEAVQVSSDRVDLSIDGLRRQFDTAIDDRGDQPVVVVIGSAGSASFEAAPRFTEPVVEVAPGSTTASMPGTIVAVSVAVGDAVTAGTPLVVMEAMKMELVVEAVTDGVVTAVSVAVGNTVEAGQVLVEIEADGNAEG